MLTVMIRHSETKREVIFSANTVEYVQRATPEEPAGLLVLGEGSEYSRYPVRDHDEGPYRDVFVMNEAGQTVARYVL